MEKYDDFKIQRPIVTTHKIPQALVYNETRTIRKEIPLSDVEHLFANGELKVYYSGTYANGAFDFLDQLPGQDW